MKNRALLFVVLIFAFALLLGGCGGKKDEGGKDPANNVNNEIDPSEKYAAKGDPNLEANLVIWAIDPNLYDDVIPEFNKYYPKVSVEVIPQGFEVPSKTLTAIAAGKGGPDIAQYHHWNFPDFSGKEGFENLLDPPYNAGKYKEAFTDANWSRWLSVDGKKLISLPSEHEMQMFYYRQDVMEDYGYPSEPEELGEYIQDPENFINMALTLKNDDKWIVGIWTDPLLHDIGWFDRDLNYVRNNEKYAELIDIAKRLHQLDLISHLSIIWDPAANQALNSGKLVGVVTRATASVDILPEHAPDTKGKWRATRMPFGNSMADQGISMAILSQSKQKEAAWAFIEFVYATYEGQKIMSQKGGTVGFMPIWQDEEYAEKEDEFLGGQKVRKLALELLKDVPVQTVTPLDQKARSIWESKLWEYINQQLDSKIILDNLQRETEAAVLEDRKILLEAMGK